ncbi:MULTISPECIES: aspartate dehydrogenase [unclassified Beijerinckia]|uniref:aspartate dehydrogenase n=1 Tax=unclassified Beijerinckia TaxID=2638183 RepID=UPI0008991388|nr:MULTISPECIES: aspartate dehydrogenase [unclassified Beijerinckia]SED94229.1 aspartate dehydrogenase [Beijerinckia sp. 28-YEA-48]
MQKAGAPLRVAIAGLGAVGLKLAEELDKGIPGLSLVAVSAKNIAAAKERLRHLKTPPAVVELASLEGLADIVIECAPAALVRQIVEPFVSAGKTAVVLSCGALLNNMDLVDVAKAHGGQIGVPTGALLGLDAVTAAAESTIRKVTMVTRKPVKGLMGAPFLEENNIKIEDIKEPMKIFSGSPREAAVGFPANLNVAVALGLAGIGVDKTTLEIWADPGIDRNTHSIEVDADSASFTMSIANIPSENPKTGRITALSVIAYLRKINAPLRVGT